MHYAVLSDNSDDKRSTERRRCNCSTRNLTADSRHQQDTGSFQTKLANILSRTSPAQKISSDCAAQVTLHLYLAHLSHQAVWPAQVLADVRHGTGC